MPDIGLRATQGHYIRNEAGLGYLIAAQECLNVEPDDHPCFCVHGTDPAAWRSIKESHSLIPGGLAGNRAAVQFCIGLLGGNGRSVSVYRTNSTIYIFFDMKKWLKGGRAAYRSANNMVCVYDAISLVYIHSVIEGTADT